MSDTIKNNNTNDEDQNVAIETVKEFLIEEYKELNNTLHKSEEIGEKRLEFFVTISSVVIAVIGFVFKDLKESVKDNKILMSFNLSIIFLLVALIGIGIIIIRRLDKRNKKTDGIIEDIKKIRKHVKNTLDKNCAILSIDYSAFEQKNKPARIFTSLHDIAKIITAALIGTATIFICLFRQLEFSINAGVSIAVFFVALTLLMYGNLRSVALALFKTKDKSITHAGGIVYKKVREKTLFLVVSASPNKSEWVLPKGHIEEKETPDITAIREVMEEAGIFAKPIKEVSQVSYIKKEEHVTVRYFLMEFIKDLENSKEGREIKWLEKNDAIWILSFEDARKVFKEI